MTNEARTRRLLGGLAVVSLLVVAVAKQVHISKTAAAPPQSEKMPSFEVDPSWPKIPNGWVTGHVPGVSTDSHGNIWIITRPNTVPDDQKAHASPPVIEFDPTGKFVQAWGGPGEGYDWPDSDHTICVDYKDNVWISGSSPASASPTKNTDDMVLKFTNKGKFLMEIGGRNKSNGNTDTKSVHLATDIFVWPKTNEVFVSDGYGNRRIIVFDADTGKFKRMWGAFGNIPTDWEIIKDGLPVGGTVTTGEGGAPAARGGGGGGRGAGGRGGGRGAPPLPTDVTGPGPQQFGNETPTGGPTHSVQISNDGMVYVADRANRRIQVFTIDGKYVRQVFVNREGPNGQSAAGIGFSADPAQQYMYVADYGNSHVVVMDRKSLQVLYQFGTRGGEPGQFQGIHHLAVDLKGNIYTGEVAPGARAQRFIFKGASATLPPIALTGEQLAGEMAAARTAAAGGRGPQPPSSELYDEWTAQQISTPGNLDNFGNHNASVQHRAPGAAPEIHSGFSHILVFTSGTGTFVVGGKIVDGPNETKIIEGGESHPIVLGEVWHIPANVAHWVVPTPDGPGVNYFVANINVPPGF